MRLLTLVICILSLTVAMVGCDSGPAKGSKPLGTSTGKDSPPDDQPMGK